MAVAGTYRSPRCQPAVWTAARVAHFQALRRQGATPAEIAAELGVTANAVKIKLSRLSYELGPTPSRREAPLLSTKVGPGAHSDRVEPPDRRDALQIQ